MTDLPDHSGLLEAARKQLKRKAPTPEQRARRRLVDNGRATSSRSGVTPTC